MIKRYELMIAGRYLRSQRKEGFISVVSAFSFIGIALGVATLIIVMAVMNGYEFELVKRILGINGHIAITSQTGRVQDYSQLMEKIKHVKGVEFAAPLINEQAMAITNGATSGVMVRAMDCEDLAKKPLMQNSIISGDISQLDRGILVGSTLAYKLGVNVGDSVKIIAASTDLTAIGSIPRMKTFKIIGIFDVGMYEYNASTIFMPLTFAQKFFGFDNSVSDIEIIAKRGASVDAMSGDLSSLIDPSLNIVDWSKSNENLITALKVERNVMFLILTLIIIVAAFNIISSMIMLVKEKTKSIAILRTIGMTRQSIIKIFMLCGCAIGVMGTLLGAILGLTFSYNIEKVRAALESMTGITLFDPMIYFLTQLPVQVNIYDVCTVVTISLLLSFLATIYPAWKASKLMPAEALRYE